MTEEELKRLEKGQKIMATIDGIKETVTITEPSVEAPFVTIKLVHAKAVTVPAKSAKVKSNLFILL